MLYTDTSSLKNMPLMVDEKDECSHNGLEHSSSSSRTQNEILEKYDIIRSQSEKNFDELAKLAADICGCSNARINFVDSVNEIIYTKSKIGEKLEGEGKCSNKSMCIKASRTNELFMIPDIKESEEFKDCRTMLSESRIRFYAAHPLINDKGIRFGVLCVMDKNPKVLNDFQKESLAVLSRQIVSLLELKLHMKEVLEVKRSLEAKNEELCSLSKIKSKFMGVIAHDIRQPLSNILISSELLMNPSDEEPFNDAAKTQISRTEEDISLINNIYSSANFAHTLVDGLLQMVKTEFEYLSLEIDTKPIDICKLLASITRQNTLYARRKSINLSFSIKSPESNDMISYNEWIQKNNKPVICNIDTHKLQQAVNNLVTNAVKFSFPHNDVQVIVEPSNDNVTLLIRDHGQGIPRNELSQIFTPWKQLSVKPTSGESSTGLGLAIVKNIVAAHGGKIWVESEVGVGTTFYITFPRVPVVDIQVIGRANSQQLPVASNDASLGEKLTPSAKFKPRLLYADDNMISQKLISKIFRKKGYEVILAYDGQEALELFEQYGGHKAFDIMLIDCEMPVLTGIDVIQAIRQNEEESKEHRLPIVSISGHSSESNIAKLKEAGADDFCPKPFSISKLVQLVDSLVTKN